MVNLLAAQKPLLHGLMKLAGVRPHAMEIEPGTVMNFWVPSQTIIHRKNPKSKSKSKSKKRSTTTNDQRKEEESGTNITAIRPPDKPAVVLVHGFAAEGIVTWLLQVGALTGKYAVYVPDLLFFGGSTTASPERSPEYQADCLAKGLRKLGVERCAVVGFSYGGMVAFKMAELHPELVGAVVASGAVVAMPDSIRRSILQRLGFSSLSEMLLPKTVKGLKALLSVGSDTLWFPDRLHRDFLQVMFANREERSELLEALVISNKDPSIPSFPQRIHLLWGENDKIFKKELAHNMKKQLGDKATFEGIKKAGHLVHLERPFVYNRCLKRFLASQYIEITPKL